MKFYLIRKIMHKEYKIIEDLLPYKRIYEGGYVWPSELGTGDKNINARLDKFVISKITTDDHGIDSDAIKLEKIPFEVKDINVLDYNKLAKIAHKYGIFVCSYIQRYCFDDWMKEKITGNMLYNGKLQKLDYDYEKYRYNNEIIETLKEVVDKRKVNKSREWYNKLAFSIGRLWCIGNIKSDIIMQTIDKQPDNLMNALAYLSTLQNISGYYYKILFIIYSYINEQKINTENMYCARVDIDMAILNMN
jgi:hypothetical protein